MRDDIIAFNFRRKWAAKQKIKARKKSNLFLFKIGCIEKCFKGYSSAIAEFFYGAHLWALAFSAKKIEDGGGGDVRFHTQSEKGNIKVFGDFGYSLFNGFLDWHIGLQLSFI